MCPFDNTADAESLKAGPVNQFTTPAGWLVLLQLTRPDLRPPKIAVGLLSIYRRFMDKFLNVCPSD